jgi:Ca-activated chloride channel family protein
MLVRSSSPPVPPPRPGFALQRFRLIVCRPIFRFILAASLLVLGSTQIFAQDDATKKERPRRVLPTEAEPQDIIKIDTDLVPVDVTVTDAKGRLVRNLRKEDFKLYEDGVERPITSLNIEKIEGAPRPVAIVFALDLSGSMTPEEVARVSDAMREFSRRLAEHPAVFAVMTFGMRVKTLQTFTNDREKLDRAFERLAHEPN